MIPQHTTASADVVDNYPRNGWKLARFVHIVNQTSMIIMIIIILLNSLHLYNIFNIQLMYKLFCI